ncbi:hypothetical protein AL755_15120 [Arthrobacter sp. ERGS1:01]|uniref:family 20 glycosylhydrolase n=1 Tax=Arthrobacter sp. ERGS1:01 TaxID=1704044 RepID=UPI0006B5B0D9|nr:family 20 glycosylhydrolase [Arthrobacter sp. ERGS1:01]ALE06479.1 hypothetical protein AL755_15120 [Arthrobacter sp. ERGS1:01]
MTHEPAASFLTDPDFAQQSLENTALVHARFVRPGADGTGSALQIGLHFEGDSLLAPGGTLPARNHAVSRGMVNKVATGVEPNTEYRLTMTIKGAGLIWGIFDAENEPYYRGFAAGGPITDRYKGMTTPGGGTEWETVEATIITGPRTTELHAFCILAENTGPGWCDSMTVTRIGPAAHAVEAPATWAVPPASANTFPVTIPAIRQFAPTEGLWSPAAGVSAVAVDVEAAGVLDGVARLLAAQLTESGAGQEVGVVAVSGEDVPADAVHLTLGEVDLSGASAKARELAAEAYELHITTHGVRVVAGGAAGALYTGSTLVQALKSAAALPAGTVLDFTEQKYRGLQVDSGRRFYTIDWLKDQIKDLAYTKLNTLSVRVKDNEGLRIESGVLPKIMDTTPGGGFWSKAEIKDLVAFARQYHVTVIPEFDIPGHSDMDTLVYPEYMFPGGEGEAAGWDYSRADVRQLLIDVLRETGETFESPFVHVGGDEFFGQDHPHALEWIRAHTGDQEATSVDAYLELFNEVAAGLAQAGFRTMMWNDMINGKNTVVELSRDITIVYWAEIYESLSAEELIHQGYELIGSSSDLYHDLWPPLDKSQKPNMTINQPLPEYQWQTYLSPFMYSRGWSDPEQLTPAAEPGSLGQIFPIWDDAHGWAPEELLTQTLLPRLRIHAQSVWNSPAPVASFAEFDPYLRFLGHAPFFGQHG